MTNPEHPVVDDAEFCSVCAAVAVVGMDGEFTCLNCGIVHKGYEKVRKLVEYKEALEWQPIETAPTDGTEILLFCPGIRCWQRQLKGEVIIGAWFQDEWPPGWYSDSASDMEGYESTGDYVVHEPVSPTHWMPLPEPPTS